MTNFDSLNITFFDAMRSDLYQRIAKMKDYINYKSVFYNLIVKTKNTMITTEHIYYIIKNTTIVQNWSNRDSKR